ncbi:unnamed protein product [Rotaria magnacalcarata]|uniref:Uncharacterized protein n=1 Tax=Rotaria magnacalcarata TaxID=392030 RepID=A0A819KRN2_9BILA|nr:unnamed protein product [Rotaria magnacalcarata]CAF3950579.1 unnamed protein product [Rotaria magnacalcarata]
MDYKYFSKFKNNKNKYKYDTHIQQFALLTYILGGRNCYEFFRLNLSGSLPHISNVEILIRNQEMRMTDSEFRFQLIEEYLRPNKCNYVFIAEDATSSICRIDYDATLNSFIGFSAPLIGGVPQPNFFQTENFEQLELWFNEIDKAKFINLYMLKSLVLSYPRFILAAYGSNKRAKAIEILKRWLFFYHQCLVQDTHVIGFSTDADARFLRAMRLCSRFFATLPNFNIFKYQAIFHKKCQKNGLGFSWKNNKLFLCKMVFILLQNLEIDCFLKQPI